MKKKITIGIIIIGVALIMAACFWFYFLPMYSDTCHYAGLMTRIDGSIAGYIQRNQGEFPSSEKDLIDQLFFKKEKTDDGFSYFFSGNFNDPGVSEVWWNSIQSEYFETLTISYGAKLSNIQVVEGKLFDQSTGCQVLLISGPEVWGLKGYYEIPTLYWYEQKLIYLVNNMLAMYVQRNKGEFPESEDDLIDKHYPRKTETSEGKKYFLPTEYNQGPNDRWQDAGEYFSRIKILYGAKLQNIKMTDGRLFDKGTDEQVLLIDGPHGGPLYYEEYSLELYEAMLHYQKDEPAGAEKAGE